MSVKRAIKVAGLLKNEIGDIIQQKIRDPRVGFVTVTEVVLSDDLRIAKVYVTVMGDEQKRAETLKGLENARPFIQSELGQRVRLRYMPELRFYFDGSLAYGDKIERLLNEIHMKDTESIE